MSRGYKYLVGVDEAGRGALCGPVVASCVALRRDLSEGIKDSKELTPKSRSRLFEIIKANSFYSFGLVRENVIDDINIFWATQKAFLKAINKFLEIYSINKEEALFIIDGLHFKHQGFNAKCVAKADKNIKVVSCASIMAKVLRDRIMTSYDSIFAGWEFSRHKGYGTQRHRTLIKQNGVSPLHRTTFVSGVLDS